jgi:hypothetical protein
VTIESLQFKEGGILILGTEVRLGTLKVPKREIFHRSDFPDFYTVKSLQYVWATSGLK